MRILLYHRVCPKNEIWPFKDDFAVSPEDFELQMKAIKPLAVGLEELAEAPVSCVNRPKDKIAVTFDDGYADNYHYAFPILKKYQIPATIFIPTDYIETGKMFWWDELRAIINNYHQTFFFRQKTFSCFAKHQKLKAIAELSKIIAANEENRDEILAELRKSTKSSGNHYVNNMMSWAQIKALHVAGINIGSHGCSHRRLSLITSNDEVETQLITSKIAIEKHLGQRITSFSYPYGRETDYDKRTLLAIEKAGYELACTGVVRRYRPNRDSRFEIPRIGIASSDTKLSFWLKAKTIYPDIYYLVRTVLRKKKVKTWE